MFSPELRKDLLTTALEGGSNYWYLIDDVSEVGDIQAAEDEGTSFVDCIYDFIERGGSLQINDYEEPTEKLGDLNLESIAIGEVTLRETFLDIYERISEDEWDADDADAWLQLAVLGSLEFG